MKKLIGTLFFVLCGILVHAQIKKGTNMLGGQLSTFESSEMATVSGIKSAGEVIGVSFGKAYKDNKVWGISLSSSATRNRYYTNGAQSSSDATNTSIISAYLRNYYRFSKKWYFVLQPELGLSSGRTKTTSGSGMAVVSQRQTAADLSVAPGITFAVSPKFHLEAFVPGLVSARLSSSKNYNSLTGAYVNKENLMVVTSSLAGGIDTDLISLGFRVLF